MNLSFPDAKICTFYYILLHSHKFPIYPLKVLQRLVKDTYSFGRTILFPSWGLRKAGLFFSPVHAVSSCHHPVLFDEGPSTGVIPVIIGQVLKGNLDDGRKEGKVVCLKRLCPKLPVTPLNPCHLPEHSPTFWARSGK